MMTRRNIVASFVLMVLVVVDRTVETVEEQRRQAFIQTDNQLRYLVDGISLHLHQSLTGGSDLSHISVNEENTNANPVTFYPPELNFKERPVGMPDVAEVIVSNPNSHNVYLLSISGSSVHFHCSFFQDKVILPGENTTFTVVFLSRHEGPIQNTLYIHTSTSSYKYEVYGVGTPNPYRLKPFLGAKVPLNSVYSSVINLYNPHSSTLQVTEMYSSGGDLHLELPGGEREANRQLWEIQPYETKSVMRASFLARVENNHTVYIRIKTNSSNENYLVLPVEVEVSSAPGIYTTTDTLEFGVMYSKDMSRTLTLHLLNRGPKPVHITSVSASPSNEALSIIFQPVKVPPDTTEPIQVAEITFHPQRALSESQFSGKIGIRSKNNLFKLSVPYVAMVLHGFLEYNASDTEFYVGESQIEERLQRDLTLTNTFNISVAIHHIELPSNAREFFEVHRFDSLVLHAKEKKVVGIIKLVNFTSGAPLNTFLRFHTNVSKFDVPLLCYNGKLAKFLPISESSSNMDLGTLSLDERRDVVFGLINYNPVQVHIKGFGSTVKHSIVEFMGVSQGKVSDIAFMRNFTGFSKKLTIPCSHFAVFRIGIKAPLEEETFHGEIFVETQYELLKIPFSFRTAKGTLSVVPSNIIFESTFPGKVASVPLYLHSSFSKPMTLTSVISLPYDPKFTYHPTKMFPPILQPNARTLVGKLNFDIRDDCEQECYTGFSTETAGGAQWASSFLLQSDVSLIDVELYEILQSRWENVLSSNKKRINVTFQIDTSEVRGFRVEGHAILSWPNLSNKQKVTFPLTQIGNSSVKDIILENPSSVPVIAQVVPLYYYPSPEAIFNVLEQSGLFQILDCLACEPDSFLLKDPAKIGLDSTSNPKDFQPHPETVVVRIEPGSSRSISLQFTPTNEEETVSVLLIRNNLTVLETVLLTGTGAYGQLRFGNRVTGSSSPLLFELTEKHLRDCNDQQMSQYMLPHFTVRRAFTVRNTGQVPVYINGFDINSSPCEGYGFRVLSCGGFYLSPNASRKVDIAFTPDFTLSCVQRTLHVHTSLGGDGAKLNFSLVATIPAHLLARCSSTLPRPIWEAVLYYVAISMMGFLMFCVIVAAYLESDRIYRCTFVPMTLTALPAGSSAANGREFGKVFDLKGMSAKLNGKLPSDMGGSYSETPKGKKSHRSSMLDTDGGSGKFSLLAQAGQSSCGLRSLNNDNLKNGKKKITKKIHISKYSSHSSSSSMSSSTRKTNTSQSSNRKLWPVNSVAASDKADKSYGKYGLDKVLSSSCYQSSLSLSLNQQEQKRQYSSATPWTADKALNVCQSKPGSKNVQNNAEEKNPVSTATSRRKEEKQPAEEKKLSTAIENSLGSPDSSDWEQFLNSKNGHQKNTCPPVVSSLNTRKSKEVGKVIDRAGDSSDSHLTVKTKSKKERDTEQISNEEVGSISPIELELPYKPKGTSSSKMKDLWRWEKAASQLKAKLHNKKPQASKTLHQVINDAQRSGGAGKGSPPPEWDQPRSTFNTDEAYNEIAQQTETFALRLSRMSNNAPSGGPPMSSRIGIPPLYYNSNRSSKPTPIGKIAPEPKRVDPKQLGPVGHRPTSFTTAPLPQVSCWNIMSNSETITSPALGTPQTPPERASGFLRLFDQKERGSATFGHSEISSLPATDNSLFGAFAGTTSLPQANIGYQKPWESVCNTNADIVGGTQKKSAFQGNNWLDFGLSKPTSESVWHMDNDLLDSDAKIDQETDAHLWRLTDSKSGSPWPSAFPWSRNTTASPTLDKDSKKSLEGNPNVSSKENTKTEGFDPFTSLQNIWNAPIPSNKDSGVNGCSSWANSFFGSPNSERRDE